LDRLRDHGSLAIRVPAPAATTVDTYRPEENHDAASDETKGRFARARFWPPTVSALIDATGRGGDMRYVLLICTDESAAVGAEERARRAAALDSFTGQLTARGTLLASVQLHRTETATRVRCWGGGDVMITDGPFAEAREQIASLFIVECKDLDEAIELAAAVSAAWYGTVEVRPVRHARPGAQQFA
jgi:hypothetical protein